MIPTEGTYRWPADREDGGEWTEAYDLFVRGSAFLESGHPGQAAALLARAKALTPGKTSVREALGRAYYALGLFDRAASEFAAVAESAPANDYAHFALGCSLLRTGDAVRGRGSLRLAVAMNPARTVYVDRLAQAEESVGRP